jgi:hypothetical protein
MHAEIDNNMATTGREELAQKGSNEEAEVEQMQAARNG